jgi:quinate dehydrogenase
LFGEHIQQSRAPFLHNTLFDHLDIPWRYQIHETSDLKEIESYLTDENFIGCAVTMPNKVRATACVDKLDAIGTGCGSINTVYVERDDAGKLITVGTNTDTVGISQSLLHSFPKEVANASGKAGLVYGAGGACRSAVYALYKLLGVSKVYIINRIADEVGSVIDDMKANGFDGEIIHVTDPEMASQLETPSVAVLTVPDFEPTTEGEILAKRTLNVFKQSPGVVLEMCYHPAIETRLFKDFTSAQWKVVTGVEAMIHQGLAQQVLWTGIPLDELPVEAVVQRIYESIESEN